MRTSGSLCPTRRITCSLAPQSSRSLERGRGGGGEGRGGGGEGRGGGGRGGEGRDRHSFRH